MRVSDFYKTDYVDYSTYDNLRKIASVIDGQKNAGRKILYTLLEHNIKSPIKVSRLNSKVGEFAEYLHGSMEDVIIGLAQDYVGTNNIPLLDREGNFGTRFTPESSAPRYIHTNGSKEFFEFFNKDDTPSLKHQTFEGAKIEPMFYVPTLPLLLINGSSGVSSGFAQLILPRNPKVVKKYIKAALNNKRTSVVLPPWFNGFNGTVEQGENSKQWLIKGTVAKIGINKVKISEITPNYNLKSYINVLDALEDKKIIQTYTDLSEDDVFEFDVVIPSKTLATWDNDTLLQKLKLIKKVTENYTVHDENNKIVVYNKPHELIDHFVRVKLHYMGLRKVHLSAKIKREIDINRSKYAFIKMVVDDKLVINKRKKANIVKDLESLSNIIEDNDSYDYLLNMGIVSLTVERMARIKQETQEKEAELNTLIKTSIEKLWEGEI